MKIWRFECDNGCHGFVAAETEESLGDIVCKNVNDLDEWYYTEISDVDAEDFMIYDDDLGIEISLKDMSDRQDKESILILSVD